MEQHKELFDEYADLKRIEKETAAKLEAIQPQLVQAMQDSGFEKIEHEQGSFSITKRKTWTFSSDYNVKKDELKSLEKQEQQTGTATFVEKTGLLFSPKKEDTNE
jgi:hypothetical protein